MPTSSPIVDPKSYKLFKAIDPDPKTSNTDAFVVLEVEGHLIPICFIQLGVDHLVVFRETANPASNIGEISGKATIIDLAVTLDVTILSNHAVLMTWDGSERQDYILRS